MAIGRRKIDVGIFASRENILTLHRIIYLRRVRLRSNCLIVIIHWPVRAYGRYGQFLIEAASRKPAMA